MRRVMFGLVAPLPILVVLMLTNGARPAPASRAEAAASEAALSSDVTMFCLPDNTVRAVFSWSSSIQGLQWLDLSIFNNDFAPGTFLGNGPLPATQSTLVWDGLLSATWHFVRVNTLTPFGWFPSATIAFFTRDDCQTPMPPPATIVGGPIFCPTSAVPIIAVPGLVAGCVWTLKGDNASYALGETVEYCYSVSQPMNVRIATTRPDGTQVVVVNGFDNGSGACVGPYVAGLPLGWRTVDMFGGPFLQPLWETHFLVQ